MFRSFSSVILLVLLGLNSMVAGQTKKADEPDAHLYGLALDACVNRELKDFAKIRSESELSNRVVEKNEVLTDGLPTTFGSVKVEFLGLVDLRDRYLKSRQRINVLTFFPALTRGTSLVINIRESWISYKKKSYDYAMEGGCKITFDPNMTKGDFEITKVELWGV